MGEQQLAQFTAALAPQPQRPTLQQAPVDLLERGPL